MKRKKLNVPSYFTPKCMEAYCGCMRGNCGVLSEDVTAKLWSSRCAVQPTWKAWCAPEHSVSFSSFTNRAQKGRMIQRAERESKGRNSSQLLTTEFSTAMPKCAAAWGLLRQLAEKTGNRHVLWVLGDEKKENMIVKKAGFVIWDICA